MHITGLVFSTLIMVCGLTNECPKPKDRVEPVENCPNSEQAYKKAASTFNCPKNCNLVFHCLLNANRTSLVEVCAPRILIVGNVCPQYNTYGERVQRDGLASCDSCPYMYYSDEIYKHPECTKTKPRDDAVNTTPMQNQSTQKTDPVNLISSKSASATTSGFSTSLWMLVSLPLTVVFPHFFCERINT